MENSDLLEKYFNNTLSPKEHLLFKQLLQSDANFKKEFIFQKDLKKVISIQEQKKLKNKLQNFEKNNSGICHIFKLPKKWLIAASIVLVLGISCFYLKTTYYPTAEKLYTQNFVPYRNIIQPVNRGENINTIEHSAFLAYENKNYHKAINLFNSLQNESEVYVSFYKTMCYLSINKVSEAITLLLPIAKSLDQNNSEKKFDEVANWYLGLAYLKNGQEKMAISQFSFIANYPENIYNKEKAKDILELIK